MGHFEDLSPMHVELIHDIVSLSGAALFFELPGLCQKSINPVQQCLATAPALAFTVLESCSQFSLEVPVKMKTVALAHLGSAKWDLQPEPIVNLSESLAEDSLKFGRRRIPMAIQ